MRWTPERVQTGVAVSVLGIGVLVYLFDRPSASVYFVPNWWTFSAATPSLFGALGDHLPTFAHAFAFILLTTAALQSRLRSSLVICAIWFGLETSLEFAQLDGVAEKIASAIPSWFQDWPVLENVSRYFVSGRFDALDIGSIALGTLAAYVTVRISTRKEDTK
jgi:hypothetical protein